VPIPVFISKKTNEILFDDEVTENVANIFEKEGADCWFDEDAQRFLGKKYKSEDYEKLSDIVEVWFDSGSTHAYVLEKRKDLQWPASTHAYVLEKRKDLQWPASMYLEGSDQHRGWFHSSLLESCGTRGRAPFNSILSHGFVVDGKGLKMSKSLGNIISPEDILKKYGADILRIWVASSDYEEDLRIDHSILEQHAEAYRKIRNTFRYILGNLNDKFQKVNFEKTDTTEFPELEQYMLHKIFVLNSKFNKYFELYNFHSLYKDLLNFCTLDLSAFYFDIRKDVLYCDPIDSIKRKYTIKFLNIVLEILLRWFAPILSFTSEEIYSLIKTDTNKSIHLEKFSDIPSKWHNNNLSNKWIELIKIRETCNSSIELKRASKEIGSSLEANLTINLSDKLIELTKGIDFSELCITSGAIIEKMTNNEKNQSETVIVKTIKAEGQKCPICWKININQCKRHS